MTPEQLRAATSRAQHLYIRAGPGSGKTFMATEAFGFLRYVRFGSDPRGVLGVTFARSARRELESRVATRWGPRAVRVPNGVHTFDDLHRRLVRHLITEGSIAWPGGAAPLQVDDSWAHHEDVTNRLKGKDRCILTLDANGDISVGSTMSNAIAPAPCFTDGTKYLRALSAGVCTHAEIRSVLSAAVDEVQYPTFNQRIRECLAAGVCHIVVDEAFDMNGLDARILERAIEAGVTVTVVGDPWQTLYEFRGSTPGIIRDLIERWDFRTLPMPGTRRFETAEMRNLADRLFNRQWFDVAPPGDDDEFDVVIAHDWSDLWTYSAQPILPAGRAGKMATGWQASCFVLLLNEVIRGAFGIDAFGVGEARRRINPEDLSSQLRAVLDVLHEPTTVPADVWSEMRAQFELVVGTPWKQPGAVAEMCMTRLKQIVTSRQAPILGLSVHQAKGLEWDRVLFLNSELSTLPNVVNRLQLRSDNHRAIYVALTRARQMVRVAYVPPRMGVTRDPVEYQRLARDEP